MTKENSDRETFPDTWIVDERYHAELRYGENPHQNGAVYVDNEAEEVNVIHGAQLNDSAKNLSFVNYLDAQSGLQLVTEFDDPAAAVIKHTIPAGCATAATLREAYERAHATDPKSSYGGIVALNRECTLETAESILDSPFKTIVVAPSYSTASLERLREEDYLRLLEVGSLNAPSETVVEKPLIGGRLVQHRDHEQLTPGDLDYVTNRKPTDGQIDSLLFAWSVVKHAMSNGTVFATGTETVGIGSGQPSRVDSVLIAKPKARDHAEGKDAEGAVLATDGFAFPDTVEVAVDAVIDVIIQPGGSVRDEAVIEAADEHGISMVFTGQRCFRHG